MVPLGVEATARVLAWEDSPHRMVALHHAAIHRRPGLWGDDPARPSTVVWLREGDDGQLEAFGAGVAGPAPGWLVARSGGRPIMLAAPMSWEGPVRARGGRLERCLVWTWLRPGPSGRPGPPIPTRRLGPDDADAFEAAAPPWALRSWGGFGALIARGAAFGVPTAGGFAAMAWTFESDYHRDKVGVATPARFRRLGLGRAAASALVGHILRDRRKQPIWSTNDSNAASMALARSLGFTALSTETLLLWKRIQGSEAGKKPG